MTNLTYGKRDVTAMAKVLSEDYATVEEAASAALETAFALYEKKSCWVIVGQLRYSDGYLSAQDPRACKVALGPYGTQIQAQNAGRSLAYSVATQEEFRWWDLPLHHGTPAAWFKARKEERQAAELAARKRDPIPQHIKEQLSA